MDERQNYERFNVDNDYEGVEQIGDEYFYRSKKQKHQQTAEDRLYGVFADSDSEGEGRGKKRSRKPADFSKPVGFVSSGITQDTTQKPEDVIKSEHQTMPAAASTGLGANAGLGAGAGASAGLGASGGLGFTSQQPHQDEDMQEEQESLLPTAFGQRYTTCCGFYVACKAYFCERCVVPSLFLQHPLAAFYLWVQDHAVCSTACSSTSSTAPERGCQSQAQNWCSSRHW